MTLRFFRRVRIFPGLRFNLTKRGLSSATIGAHGFAATVRADGMIVNVGAPGTGLSWREWFRWLR